MEDNKWPQAAMVIGCSFAVAWAVKSVLTFVTNRKALQIDVENKS